MGSGLSVWGVGGGGCRSLTKAGACARNLDAFEYNNRRGVLSNTRGRGRGREEEGERVLKVKSHKTKEAQIRQENQQEDSSTLPKRERDRVTGESAATFTQHTHTHTFDSCVKICTRVSVPALRLPNRRLAQ